MKRNEFIDNELDKLEKACKELNQRQELRSLNERLKELKKSNGYLKQENQRLKKDIKIKEGLHETTFKNLMEERKENQRLNNVLNELEKIIQTCIYGIEPEGCSINFNCEYDSEEDYISGMQTQARLNTYKFVLKQLKELKELKESDK